MDNLVNLPQIDGDWLSRQNIPDMYPRQDDPFRPMVTAQQVNPPPGPTPAAPAAPDLSDLFTNLTVPGSRPTVIQKGVSFTIPVGLTPVPLTNRPFYCETILLNLPSSAGNSVFYGFGSSITTASGEEIRPGVPQSFKTDNDREQWEIQRPLEVICNMIAYYFGFPGLMSYRAPRVVWNTNDWNLVAGVAGPTNISVTLFYTPEMQ